MNGRRWTEQDTATLRRMSSVGYVDREIAAVTGHSRETVTRHRNALGIAESRRTDWWGKLRRFQKPGWTAQSA